MTMTLGDSTNGISDEERRLRRQQRFKAEAKTWQARAKENEGQRMAWSGGKMTSNKEEALQMFLQRKAEQGACLDSTLVSSAKEHVVYKCPGKVAVGAGSKKADQPTIKAQTLANSVPHVRAPPVAIFLREAVPQPIALCPKPNSLASTKAAKKNAKRAEKRSQKREV
eukprot:CAMPEP_0198208166 /NCGR_PEP_ID=MMETSP1445-20131203/11559_1 /TAXON_ID=36898 /ORGANISM="Pyramimonas sp., Strain CCMP2087" /LENGTH=167 /DNA_ID=CAMNT_0043881463 /DNA_START=128 /DNA_END=631 /DNA_ORIENTATION=-